MSGLRTLGVLVLWFCIAPFAYLYVIYQISDSDSPLRRWLRRTA